MRIELNKIVGGIYLLPFVLIGRDAFIFGFLFWHCAIYY
jgi:hypothetical protein